MAKRRVVVTGLGIVSPVGNDLKSSWASILAGKSGAALITEFDTSGQAVKFACEVKGFDASEYIARKELKKMDTFIHYGIAASDQAIKDSGLVITEQNAERIGIAVGSGIGGLPMIEKNKDAMTKGGARKISPFLIPGSIINMISGNLSIMHGIKGPNIAPVTACTTGTHSVGLGARMIAYGDADVMIVGGAEKACSPLGIGGFAASRALSRNNDNPQAASRPWDRDRDGFVLGDGAGILVLEEYEHAKARGAKIYAEMAGFGMSGDAYHMTSPSAGGEGAARCMVNAMKDAGVNPDDIQFVNAHGTSTPAGDVAETMAMKLAFGEHAKSLAITSTKSMTGHLLGAAGGIEAVFTIMSLQDQVASPTINLDNQDPACDLDFVPHTARDMKIDIAMSNSFGFGGTNGTVIFKRV